MTKSNQRDGLRIGDNGILIPSENNQKNYKLVCYDGNSTAPMVTAVYKLENYDYNIHDEQLDVETILDELKRCDENDKLAKSILGNYSTLSGTIFKKYNKKSGRFIYLTRGSDENLQYSEEEPKRTGISGNAEQGVSDSGINDNIYDDIDGIKNAIDDEYGMFDGL